MAKKASAQNGKIRSNCSAPEGSVSAPKLSACSRCGLVVYCSRDCQRAHWKANHKQYCISKVDRVSARQNLSNVTGREMEFPEREFPRSGIKGIPIGIPCPKRAISREFLGIPIHRGFRNTGGVLLTTPNGHVYVVVS